MPSIKNTPILILGGTSGIGLGVAEKCLSEGATVHIASSSPSRVKEVTESLQQRHSGSSITGHVCDLGTDDVEVNLKSLLEKIKPLNHIVFTAGDALSISPISDIDLPAIKQAGHVRFFVPLLLSKLAPNYMPSSSNSSITFTTGSVADKPIPGWTMVNGFCTALHGVTKNLAVDLKPLRVNLVSPGPVKTPLLEKAEVLEGMAEFTVLGKVGSPEDVAEAYIYLMKDGNATGGCVRSDGGAPLK